MTAAPKANQLPRTRNSRLFSFSPSCFTGPDVQHKRSDERRDLFAIESMAEASLPGLLIQFGSRSHDP